MIENKEYIKCKINLNKTNVVLTFAQDSCIIKATHNTTVL